MACFELAKAGSVLWISGFTASRFSAWTGGAAAGLRLITFVVGTGTATLETAVGAGVMAVIAKVLFSAGFGAGTGGLLARGAEFTFPRGRSSMRRPGGVE